VSTFPPARCGVGQYAQQQAEALEGDGAKVRRIDITHLQKDGWTREGVRRLFAEADACERLLVHFQVWMYRDERRPNLTRYLWPQLVLLRLLRRYRNRTTMVVHEYAYKLYKGPGAFLQWPLAAAIFAAPHRLVFHTKRELDGFKAAFPRRRGLEVVEHHKDYRPRIVLSQAEARQRLGITGPIVLAIGFYKAHKGFLEFAGSFHRMRTQGDVPGTLHIVTSLQDEGDRESAQELKRLEEEFASSPHVKVHVEYQDDEAFDTWISAADAVALPYKAAYSSGVAARARIMGRPLVVTDVGGLPDQAGPDGVVYRDEDELRAGLRRVLPPR
jgi:glycosyltransferase involved in cell wall biosynthesis